MHKNFCGEENIMKKIKKWEDIKLGDIIAYRYSKEYQDIETCQVVEVHENSVLLENMGTKLGISALMESITGVSFYQKKQKKRNESKDTLTPKLGKLIGQKCMRILTCLICKRKEKGGQENDNS